MASDASVVLKGIRKSFGAVEVIKGIDLEVAEHEVIALIGASGSGKSTLLRCINLIEPIDAGRILIEGEEITGKGVKVVYDSVGKDTWDGSLNCLRPFGLMASFGNASGVVPPFAPGILGPKGSLYLTRQTLFTHIATREATQAMADDLFAVVGSGAVKIRIDQRYPLAEAERAHRDLEARRTTGSSILTP